MLTIDHTRGFQADATGKPPKYDALEGTTNGIDWHLGPPPDHKGKLQTTCPDCFREITSGMTVYRPELPSSANAYYRNNKYTPAIYVCAACFDWAKWIKAHHTIVPYKRLPAWMKEPTVAASIKALDKVTRELAPRFRIVGREDLKAMSEPELDLLADNDTVRLARAAVRAEKRLRHLKAVA